MSTRELELVLPGRLDGRTGGTLYDRRMVHGLRAAGWRVRVHELDTSFPAPSPDALRRAAQILAGIPGGQRVVIDGLALGAMPELARKEAGRLALIALVHHPLALETGLEARQAQRLRASEREALSVVRDVITTSATTASALSHYDVTPDRIAVVNPGTDPAPRACGSGGPQVQLLCVATLTPRKGHAVLFQALSAIRDRPWRLLCAGSDSRDSETAEALRRRIQEFGLGHRITLLGELEERALAELYHRSDALVLASHYEGYGMVLDEALARGLAIVATRAGAIAETVPASAALLVPPGDAVALAAALRRLLDERGLRSRLAAAAHAAGQRLPTWQQASASFAAALERMVAA